jgi:hypothetical protein
VPGVVLRGVRMRGMPDGGGQHRPPLRAHRLLRPLCALPLRLLGAPGGRRAAPPVYPMCVPRKPPCRLGSIWWGFCSVDRKFRRGFISFLSISAGINHFHKTPDREWFETDAVLRVSLGNFLFFTILAVIMAGIKDQKDPRDKIHHGGWMAKVFCWVVIVFLMFFVPNGVVSFYGELVSLPACVIVFYFLKTICYRVVCL